MQPVLDLIHRAAETSLPVLITGESGSGKGVLARTLHHLGPKRDRPFVAVNMSAVPDTLFAAEFFGVEAGAFTDADQARVGHFERAADGTLLLDEIADLPLEQQAALLRVLQTRTLTRVGGSHPVPLRARIIAATSADLLQRVAEGRFREDLYHRLAIVYVRVPPLRGRLEELPLLVQNLLAEGRDSWGIDHSVDVTPDALDALGEYDWPGNVRELGNAIARMAMQAPGGVIDAALVRRQLGLAKEPAAGALPFALTLEQAVDKAFAAAHASTGGDVDASAKVLGVSRATVYRWLKRRADA
ncbi:MAG: sigma-54 dependent transcriptional regulator [Myxococcota bacterium]